ncbi:MAG: bifunctional 3-deoxy-7-phosphoheptulonate synthase/chorismate mutase type II [Muribaculaceae bacterium]|nr:bifunctional 3-deoxy-7-phosphoheptulonate synthase/chorismate mutase type II [Muribaculaceae bacterium]
MRDLLPIIEDAHKPLIIAGPCSAESEQQVLATAYPLADMGIKIFRAGIWKPRTRPGDFEGVGAVGLPWLSEVKAHTGMLTATEIANRYHAECAIQAGVDILWIGARTSANPFAMQEIADVIAERRYSGPVLVKNPVNPDLELWIGAMQRLYNAGVRRLGAIHRGFSAYGEHLYRNPPQWRIPLELRRRYPQLPLICDPSHIGGKRELIQPLSQQALDMGFDGLIIESHCSPQDAWSDKAQQVTPDALRQILAELVIRKSSGTTENLDVLRSEIDRIDAELLEVLSKRMEICRQIGLFKKEHGIPVVQADRYGDILASRIRAGEEMHLGPDFLRILLSAVHEESVRQQITILNEK